MNRLFSFKWVVMTNQPHSPMFLQAFSICRGRLRRIMLFCFQALTPSGECRLRPPTNLSATRITQTSTSSCTPETFLCRSVMHIDIKQTFERGTWIVNISVCHSHSKSLMICAVTFSFGGGGLLQALINILKQKDVENDPDNVINYLRPFRVIISLLDKPEIGKQ